MTPIYCNPFNISRVFNVTPYHLSKISFIKGFSETLRKIEHQAKTSAPDTCNLSKDKSFLKLLVARRQ